MNQGQPEHHEHDHLWHSSIWHWKGADPENSERGGRNTCPLYRYFLFFWEFNKNNTNFQRKRRGHDPFGQPVNPPLMTRKEYSKYGFKQIRELSKIQVQVIKIKRSKKENTNVDKIKTTLAWLS